MPVAHRGHGIGTGQTAVLNASVYLALTPAKLSTVGVPQGEQHPLISGVH
jgi:hypothetical protein